MQLPDKRWWRLPRSADRRDWLVAPVAQGPGWRQWAVASLRPRLGPGPRGGCRLGGRLAGPLGLFGLAWREQGGYEGLADELPVALGWPAAVDDEQAGIDAAPHHSVAVQLAAQEAKAWARIGDRRQTEVALDRGRRLLDALPYPENLAHHFVVDPTKFDFYAMDCYRHLAEDKLAENLAGEVIRASTDFDGTERAPMRTAEARITLGVVAARQGDIEQAIHQGERALAGPRKSLPSLAMVSRDLIRVLKDRYPSEQATMSYLDELHTVVGVSDLGRSRIC